MIGDHWLDRYYANAESVEEIYDRRDRLVLVSLGLYLALCIALILVAAWIVG